MTTEELFKRKMLDGYINVSLQLFQTQVAHDELKAENDALKTLVADLTKRLEKDETKEDETL